MTAASASSLMLTTSPRAGRQGPLYPEQTADFDIVLHNRGSAPVSVKGLDGNLDTPIVRLFDSKGLIGEYDKRAMGTRAVGDISTLVQPSPKMVSIPAGGQIASWVNLWKFHDALPPGSYSFDVVHNPAPGSAAVVSDPLRFEIVPAQVTDAALGYDSRSRSQTELAWLAAGKGASKQRLLLRESGFAGHASLHQGANPLGEFENGSRLALGQLAWDAPATRLGWLAVIDPQGHATAIQFASAFEQGQRQSFALGITGALPVPRFPHRGQAVILATGRSANGPALAWAAIGPNQPRTGLIPLKALPVLSACAFSASGPIELLFVTSNGRESTLSRMAIDESGKVIAPERAIRTTSNEFVAAITGQRSPMPFFWVLEADRQIHNRMTLLRIGMDGKVQTADLGEIKGWPATSAPGSPAAEPARQIQMEQAPDGGMWVSLTNARGDLYCGKADGSLTLVREAKGEPAAFPQVAALRSQPVSCAAFTPAGIIFHSGGGSNR